MGYPETLRVLWCFLRSLTTAWISAVWTSDGYLRITAAHLDLVPCENFLSWRRTNNTAKCIKARSPAKAEGRKGLQSLWSNRRPRWPQHEGIQSQEIHLASLNFAPESPSDFESGRLAIAEDALEERPGMKMTVHGRYYLSSQLIPCLVESRSSKCCVSSVWALWSVEYSNAFNSHKH